MRARDELSADGFDLFYGLDEFAGWPEYLAHYRETRFGRDLRDGEVPTLLLAAEIHGTVVGHVGVRLATDPARVPPGGHVGYAVFAPFRRRGLATEMLRHAMVLLWAEGVDDVVVTCRDTNVASAGVIERCGGRLESIFDFGDAKGDMRRYVIRAPRDSLRLRPFHASDEDSALGAQVAMRSDDMQFLPNWADDDLWGPYLERLRRERLGDEVPVGWVRTALLAASVGTELVGRTSIRLELIDSIVAWNGHIGYAVLEAHRRRGYATEILRQALIVARAEGVERVIMTCHEHNVGSSTVIERHGGRLNSVGVTSTLPGRWRRYYID